MHPSLPAIHKKLSSFSDAFGEKRVTYENKIKKEKTKSWLKKNINFSNIDKKMREKI